MLRLQPTAGRDTVWDALLPARVTWAGLAYNVETAAALPRRRPG
jgi:hypothetical protein